jgi:hypothetical protein
MIFAYSLASVGPAQLALSECCFGEVGGCAACEE